MLFFCSDINKLLAYRLSLSRRMAGSRSLVSSSILATKSGRAGSSCVPPFRLVWALISLRS